MQPGAGRAVPNFPPKDPPPIAWRGETVANLPPALVESVLAGGWAEGLDETGGTSQLLLSPTKLQMDLLLKKRESKPEHVGSETELSDLGSILALGVSEHWEGGRDEMCVCSDFPTGFELVVWPVHRDVRALGSAGEE